MAKTVTVRIFLLLVAAKGWTLHQIDINIAFLYDFIDEEVYMYPSEDYTKANAREVCKLR